MNKEAVQLKQTRKFWQLCSHKQLLVRTGPPEHISSVSLFVLIEHIKQLEFEFEALHNLSWDLVNFLKIHLLKLSYFTALTNKKSNLKIQTVAG